MSIWSGAGGVRGPSRCSEKITREKAPCDRPGWRWPGTRRRCRVLPRRDTRSNRICSSALCVPSKSGNISGKQRRKIRSSNSFSISGSTEIHLIMTVSHVTERENRLFSLKIKAKRYGMGMRPFLQVALTDLVDAIPGLEEHR